MQKNKKQSKPWYKTWLVILPILFLFGVIGSLSEEEPQKSPASNIQKVKRDAPKQVNQKYGSHVKTLDPKNEAESQDIRPKANKSQKAVLPYKYISTKTEQAGNNKNKMELYAYSGNFDLNKLKVFCRSKKQKFKSGMFYYLVIFDYEKNASFPKNPFTAMYGLEENRQKHIRAYYEFNRVNGYSRLNIYSKNKWESLAKEISI